MTGVSVVIASNRMNRYLDEAVESVLRSDGVEFELVLVLDGVPLRDPAPKWASDPRVQIVLREHSGGPAAAANDGIGAARFPIIARLDSDDIIAIQRLHDQLQVLEGIAQPVLVGSRTTLIDEKGSVLGQPKQPSGPDIRRELLLQNVVPHSTFMFRKADALKVGLYDARLGQMEDYDFLLRIALLGPIAMLNTTLVQYRVHASQISKKSSWRGEYIHRVIHGRRALGKQLGLPKIEVETKLLIWRIVQVIRSAGLMKPRYLMGITSPGQRQRTRRELRGDIQND